MSARGLIAPENALALALVATRARREANRSTIVELASRADFRTLEALLRAQGMLSLVGRRLLKLIDYAPDDFVERVRDYDRQTQRQGVQQQLITIRLAAALTDAGIRTLPLKGPLLGERIHGELGARVSADIDLLVASDELVAAIEVLSTLGYRRPPRALPPHLSRPNLHECLRSTVDLPEVELHWRVHHYEQRFSAAMLARAEPGPDGCLRPAAPDELIALLLFYARDGMAGLRLLADLTGWWDHFGDTLIAVEVDHLAREHPAIVPALTTAALTAQRLGGLPAEHLFEPETLSRASHPAMRLSNWPMRGRKSQIAANVALIDLLLMPPSQRRTWLTRHLWLSEAALCGEWSDAVLARGALARARLLHIARVGGRCAGAVWQLRGDGEWARMPAGPKNAGGAHGR
ncbi:MAG TPA: nucleotidyltransferase family protein [Solirubrobacteraceae bacterium]|nr:nucleotidyltransferase family protein [Solirubrobacteraceae bacterium]